MKKLKSVSSVVSIGSPGSLLLHDEFTDTNGVLLPAHTIAPYNPYGGSWVKANTYNIDIQSNKANYTSGGATPDYKDNDHYVEVYSSGLTVHCDLQIGDQASIIFHTVVIRYIDNLNSIAVQWQTAGGSSQALQIREQINTSGSSDVGISDSKTGSYVSPELLTITDDGENIVATLGGMTASYASTTHNTATKIAIRTTEKSGQTWDNMKVWKT